MCKWFLPASQYSSEPKAFLLMGAKTVFISYRRDSTGKLFARLLAEELTRHGYDVFLDVDSLDAGKWEEQILTQVPVRSHFLLLLTPGSSGDLCNSLIEQSMPTRCTRRVAKRRQWRASL